MRVVLSDPFTWVLFRWGWVLMGCVLYLALVVLLVILDRISRRRRRALRPSPLWQAMTLAGLLYLAVAAAANKWIPSDGPALFWPLYVPVVIAPVVVILLKFAFPDGVQRKAIKEVPQEEQVHADRC